MQKKTVYLAGPISGCNDAQKHEWRDEVMQRYGKEFDFIDATARISESVTPWDAVNDDRRAILDSDAVLANMWRESIGTAVGISLAAIKGKPVFVVDPNRINSRVLAFYATSIEKTVADAMRRVREHFKAESSVRSVIKRSGGIEPFDRDHLASSIRKACQAAKQDDILAPAVVVPEVIGRLLRNRADIVGGKVPTTAIRKTVWDVLSECESDPRTSASFTGIRAAWESFDEKRRPSGRHEPDKAARVTVHETPRDVRVFTAKSHSTIWGRKVSSVGDIPPSSRPLFHEIMRVDGIAEIRLMQFQRVGGRAKSGRLAEIIASRDRGIIEGKCFDNGEKGDVQTFQIKVHDPALCETTRQTVVEHLRTLGFLAPSARKEFRS